MGRRWPATGTSAHARGRSCGEAEGHQSFRRGRPVCRPLRRCQKPSPPSRGGGRPRPPIGYRPPRPLGQRAGKRNARKEEPVKCGFVPRLKMHPRRGNQPANGHRAPPHLSGDHRKPAGTISRRPSYLSKLARNIFSFSPGAAHFLFDVSKENAGRICQAIIMAESPRPMGRTPILPAAADFREKS